MISGVSVAYEAAIHLSLFSLSISLYDSIEVCMVIRYNHYRL